LGKRNFVFNDGKWGIVKFENGVRAFSYSGRTTKIHDNRFEIMKQVSIPKYIKEKMIEVLDSY